MTHLRGDLGYATAIELKQGYARGDVRPTEVLRGVLERIDAVNPRVNAFSVIMRDEAMVAAKQSEQRLSNREAGPLEGIPVTIKDAFDVAGYETSMGTYALEAPVATCDNVVVERLRKAGAVVIGKTTMSEFAWSGLSRNPVTGITHNPWGYGLDAGASSAGAGAAAAAGFGPLHLGLGWRRFDPHAIAFLWQFWPEAHLRARAPYSGFQQRLCDLRRADDPHRGRCCAHA